MLILMAGITDLTRPVSGEFIQQGSSWVSQSGCTDDCGCYTISYDGTHWQLIGGTSCNNQATGGTNPNDPTGIYTTNNLPPSGILFSNDGTPGWNDSPGTSRFVLIWNWGGWATDIWAMADNQNGGTTVATATGIGPNPGADPVVTWGNPSSSYTSELHPFNLVLAATANPVVFEIVSFQAVDPVHDNAILTAADLGNGFSYEGTMPGFSGSAQVIVPAPSC